jgi:glycine/D-amino acid oxidase-like deaminating enzyme
MPKAIVIGQGIAGSVIALTLAQRNWEVVMVNDPSLPSSSQKAAGLWNPVSFKRVTALNDIHLYLKHLQGFYSEQEKNIGAHFYHPINIARILPTQDYRILWEKKMTTEKMAPLIQKENSPFSGWNSLEGWGKVEGSGWLNVQVFLSATRDFFTKQNAYFEENSTAYLAKHPTKESDTIIWCTGLSAMPEIWNPIKVIPNKGHVVEFKQNELDPSRVYHYGNFCLPLGNQTWRMGSTYEWDVHDDSVMPETVDQLVQNLKDKFSGSIEVTKAYVGHRPTVHDRSPILGKHPIHSQHVVFNGMGTKGVLNAPYMAWLLAEHLEKNSEIPGPYSASRFF